MAKWSGYVSAEVTVPADRVWKIAQFADLSKWDPNAIQSSSLQEGDGCSSGSVRQVVFNKQDGSTGSLVERLTYYNAEDYTYCYEMDDNPFGYEGYSSTFRLEDHKDGTTTVNWSFGLDPKEDSSEYSVVSSIEGVFKRRISLLESAAAAGDDGGR